MGPVGMINFLSVLCCLCLNLVLAIDTIRSSQSIKDKDSDFIISNGSTFKLGFFSPVNSTSRYVGIWYTKNSVSPAQWVWVANRQKPLKDASGVLTIFKDGNLVILDGQKKILWSSEVTKSVVNSKAQLLESGNLFFQFPTNTMLPNMKISSNVRTGKKVQCTSWKSPSDPSIGSFSSGVQPQHPPQAFVWKDGSPFWRSGPWSGRTFTGMQELYHVFQNGLSFVEDQDGTFVLSFFYVNMSLSHIVLTTQGDMELRYWDNEKEDWKFLWKALKSECHFYGKCGEFGSCYSRNSPICSCLRGFKPNDTKEWNRGNWTSGCVRRIPLQCGKVNSTGSEDGKMDGFLKLKMMKVPDFAEWSAALEDDCRQQCLQNCSCIAYAYDIGIGCMSRTRNLIDTNQWSSSGVDLYIRLAYLELGVTRGGNSCSRVGFVSCQVMSIRLHRGDQSSIPTWATGYDHPDLHIGDLMSHRCYPNPTRALVGNKGGMRFILSASHYRIQTWNLNLLNHLGVCSLTTRPPPLVIKIVHCWSSLLGYLFFQLQPTHPPVPLDNETLVNANLFDQKKKRKENISSNRFCINYIGKKTTSW
ncbi:hypothetical protein ACB098_03G005700 [Castanea mollissima]